MKENTFPERKDISEGDVVTLGDCSDSWGTVVEIIEMYGLPGARVLWTMKGYVCWSPIEHLSYSYTPEN